jgi:hypothetical protein
MDQKEIYIKQNIEKTREAMSEKIERLESRIHKALEGPKSTIHTVIGSIDRLKGTIEETKLAIDHGLDTINQAVDETITRVNPTADLIARVNHDPWIMIGSAILMGYVMGSLNRGDLFAACHTHTQVEESYR